MTRQVAIIGAGWMGLETAAAVRHAGPDVTLLESEAMPLLRVLGPDAAPIFADLHQAHGVDLRCQIAVAELIGSNGSVTGVMLSGGSRIEANLALVGVGITPNTELTAAAGLQVENGVIVDEHLCTSDPDIFAAGDVDNWRLGRHPASSTGRIPSARVLPPLGRCSDKTPSTPDRRTCPLTQDDLGIDYTGDIGPSGYDQVIFRRHADTPRSVRSCVGSRNDGSSPG